MAAPAEMQGSIPTRSATTATRSSTLSDDDAVPGEDTSEVTKLFHERLQAWKHACGYLEDYLKATEKMQQSHGKEYEKVLKVCNLRILNLECGSIADRDTADGVTSSQRGPPFRPAIRRCSRLVREHTLQYYCTPTPSYQVVRSTC
jgi:hypothetical protein